MQGVYEIIGEFPEAYEAALLATYPAQGNPVIDALHGSISVRQLRVMVENLPPDNAAARKRNGVWGDRERLVHDVTTQLRFLRADLFNIVRGTQPPITDPELFPTPETAKAKQASVRPVATVQMEQDHLQAVLSRANPH